MALPLKDADNYTNVFMPQQYQLELLDAALNFNTIGCVGNLSTKTFISMKLIQEMQMVFDRNASDASKNKTIFISENQQNACHYAAAISDMTNLKVQSLGLDSVLCGNVNVIVGNSANMLEIISNESLSLTDVAVLIVDDCHYSTYNNHPMSKILERTRIYPYIRILGFTQFLYTATAASSNPGKIEADLNFLETAMNAKVDTASELSSLLRFSTRPTEHLIECETYQLKEIDRFILEEIDKTRLFIRDHHYQKMKEIYEEEFLEDLLKMGDPTAEPLRILDEFSQVVENLGVWCASRAAAALIYVVAKLKIKTPYQQNFILLGAVSTLMYKIKATLDMFFTQFVEEDIIYDFGSPKIFKLMEILRLFKPSKRIIPLHDKALQEEEVEGTNDITFEEGEKLDLSNIKAKYNRRRNWKTQRKKNKPMQRKVIPVEKSNEQVSILILVKNNLMATTLQYVLSDVKTFDSGEFWWLTPQFCAQKTADPAKEPREAETQHRRIEEVLHRFRTKECNLVIGTSMLEEGINLPKCDAVIGFDFPVNFQSYVRSRSRASAARSHFFALYELHSKERLLNQLAKWCEIERRILKRCRVKAESVEEHEQADLYDNLIGPYRTDESGNFSIRSTNAIACVNRYCSRLPSDIFTRLTPIWRTNQVIVGNEKYYVTCIRLPINCPYRKEIKGVPMPTAVLSRRVAALEVCRQLHLCGQLDDELIPMTKQAYTDANGMNEAFADEEDALCYQQTGPDEPMPGTYRRKQFYKKKISDMLANSLPVLNDACYLYNISMTLTCPIPEEQNIRNRPTSYPELTPQSFGFLLSKKLPRVNSFPIYTRCGEVLVEIKLVDERVILNEERLERVTYFSRYVIENVIRLRKLNIRFSAANAPSKFFIVPTTNDHRGDRTIDWPFLDMIFNQKEFTLSEVPESVRKSFQFKKEEFVDAVVTPWYRNREMPQYYYVAEICTYLSAKSPFPAENYRTFEEYYQFKYNLRICSLDQPLLDVDHSARRLNFLTPRYVSRKGIAMPSASKERRDSQSKRQILIPELCYVHAFPVPLWKKAVALPTIIYRLNGLLLAEEIRDTVANEMQCGNAIRKDSDWKPLSFGWSLSDVIRRTQELREAKVLREAFATKEALKLVDITEEENGVELCQLKPLDEYIADSVTKIKNIKIDDGSLDNGFGGTKGDRLEAKEMGLLKEEKGNELEKGDEMEIGHWNNEMASSEYEETREMYRYSSPTDWLSDDDEDMDDYDSIDSGGECDEGGGNLRIQFMGDFLAEAHDRLGETMKQMAQITYHPDWNDQGEIISDAKEIKEEEIIFQRAVEEHRIHLREKITRCDQTVYLDEADEWNQVRKIPLGKVLTDWRTPTNENDIVRGSPSESNNSECGNVKHSKTKISSNGVEKYCNSNDNKEAKCTTNNIKNETECASDANNVENAIVANIGELNTCANNKDSEQDFSFDYQPDLANHPGPNPALLLEALTMSQACDGLSLERLETVGDSFLKYSSTCYLYCEHLSAHEGKLSYMRSKQVSNLNLYRLGRVKELGKYMVGHKFDPQENWLPPCYELTSNIEDAMMDSNLTNIYWNLSYSNMLWDVGRKELAALLTEKLKDPKNTAEHVNDLSKYRPIYLTGCNYISDKNIADCVESLIGAYLISCGPRGAQLFMSWLGIKVLPEIVEKDGSKKYGCLRVPKSPFLSYIPNAEAELKKLSIDYERFEDIIGYKFNDPAYLVEAMTHTSYTANKVTDCYQKLEFLGDAILDYLITRHLFESERKRTPGILTDLRSALVNNTIFASLAIQHDFHRYFKHSSPGLAEVIHRFLELHRDNQKAIFDEYYLLDEGDTEELENVEVPKALGDIFESVAGAIYLDSEMSLDAVWKVYYPLMRNAIDQFSYSVPKSPVRELLELEPETAKFGGPEKLADGKRVRVTVEIFGKGTYKGVGRNYRIAKCAAAKCALRQLKKKGLIKKNATNKEY